MKRKFLLCLFVLLLTISLTGCGDKKEVNNNQSNNNQQQNTNNTEDENNKNKEENNSVVIDDKIIEFDDEDNGPYEEEVVRVDEIINCDGCVFAYFSEAKRIGSSLSSSEYTNDITNLKTMGKKQRHNFFGLVLSGNTISKAYSCIYKNNKIYCIQGSDDGSYFTSNIGILNQIFTADQCKYISAGNTYTCTDGNYNGDTQTTGLASLHYETSCIIYGNQARTGEIICH